SPGPGSGWTQTSQHCSLRLHPTLPMETRQKSIEKGNQKSIWRRRKGREIEDEKTLIPTPTAAQNSLHRTESVPNDMSVLSPPLLEALQSCADGRHFHFVAFCLDRLFMG